MEFIQLPSVAVDNIVETALPDGALVINRQPDPGEQEVARDTAIRFEIYNVGGPAPASSAVSVDVDGDPVVVAGAIQSGWGVVWDPTLDASTLSVRLQLNDASFDSDAVVAVRVRVPALDLDETWEFRTLDETAPEVLAAVGRAKRVIRVTFSEPVVQADAAGAGDALNPANYAVDRLSIPAVDLVIVDVDTVSETAVDLTTDIDQTFGAAYQLTVSGVTDLSGNVIVDPPNNVVPFTGFAPAFPPGRRFLLTDFLPAMNLAEDSSGDLRMFLAILQEVVNVLLSDIDSWTEILDCDRAPEAFVDEMLAGLGSPFDFDLTVVDKRRLIHVLVPLYQLRGTRPGLIAAIQFFLGIAVTVETYTGTGWELGDDTDGGGDELNDASELGNPPATLGPGRAGLYSFRIVSPVDLTETQRDQVAVLANFMRGAHEHYLGTWEPSLPDPTLY
jgi:phage tail-like protein